MSDFSGTVAKSESGRVLPRRIFDDILALANSLLEDECPIADFENWLFPIDDTLLELKLWAKAVGVEQGFLERVVRHEDLCFVVGEILHDVITPLQDIKTLCENPEILTSPEIQATVSTAIEQFQSSASILMDTVASTLIDTVEFFQKSGANAKEESLLRHNKPMGSITDSPHEVKHNNQEVPTCDNTAEGQQKRVSGNPRREPPPRIKTSFKAFLEVLKEMSPQERQAIHFGELPILRHHLWMGIYPSTKRGADQVYTEDKVTAVAVTLARFHDAWLEMDWTTPPTSSDVKSKIDCVPHVAKIWLILHEMGKEYLLDYFCENEKTDQSLPLDVLTLERILPPDSTEDASIFADVQSRVLPHSRRLVGSEVSGNRDLSSSKEHHSKRSSYENIAEGQIPRKEIGVADHRSSDEVGSTEILSQTNSRTVRDEHFKKPLTLAGRSAGAEIAPSNREDTHSPINYETEDDSDLQLAWSKIMDEGAYKTSTTYTKVEVLLLCWNPSCSDMMTKDEIDGLKAVFEGKFNYHAEVKYLDTRVGQKLQVRVNAIMAAFVGEHDGPNTLLIVYYAGHGRPGREVGNLELLGQISPNDPQKHLDVLVFNQTDIFLSMAEADVLEIFDCCYAGQIGRTKGQGSFEYLAATDENGFTKVPGKDSFTSALIYALETLVNEREDGRFTTVALLNKIIFDAPHFPKEQKPILFRREEKSSLSSIMLHPLHTVGSDDGLLRKETEDPERYKGTTLTLHYDFIEKPSQAYIEMFGKELNDFFQRNVGVDRVRWGGLSQTLSKAKLKQLQRTLEKSTRSAALANTTTALDLLTPPVSNQSSRRTTEPVAIGSPSADISSVSSIRPLDSSDEDEGQNKEPKGRRKRRRTMLHGEGP